MSQRVVGNEKDVEEETLSTWRRGDTLDVAEAASYLKMHPATLMSKARQGVIPGAKPGKRWVFLRPDLDAYVRSSYADRRQTTQGGNHEEIICHSTSAGAHRIGGPVSQSMDDEYNRALGLATKRRHKNTKPN
jgi:excisionase family DNA binding protein